MSRHQIRNVLPPTTRNFEARTQSLAEQISQINRRVIDIEDKNDYTNALLVSNSEYTLFASLAALHPSNDNICNILLAGWYGADNCGDELMMQTVLEYMPESLLANTTVLLWNNQSYPIAKIDPRVKTLHYPFTTNTIQALTELFDIVIWGGGAIIDDSQYNLDPLNLSTGNLLIHLSNRMIAQGKQVYCIGLSSNNSINNKPYIEALQTIINGAAYFSLRDPYSLKALKKAGVDVSRVRLESDIVFANKLLHTLGEKNGASSNTGEDRPIGVVLHCFDELVDFNYQLVSDVMRIARQNENHQDRQVWLVPFYNESESDTQYLKALVERIKANDPEALLPKAMPYEDNLIHSSLLDCGVVISCRYHASLVAGCLRIPFVAICNDLHSHYPNKTRYLLDQLFPDEKRHRELIALSSYSREKLEESLRIAQERPTNVETINGLFNGEAQQLTTTLSNLKK